VPFESFRNLFKGPDAQVEKEQDQGITENEPPNSPHEKKGLPPLEHKVFFLKSDSLESENRAKEREAAKPQAEAKIAKTPEILRQETLEELPKIERAVERLSIGMDNIVVRINALDKVADFTVARREYLPLSKYTALVERIRDQATNIRTLLSMFEYNQGGIRQSPIEMKQTLLPILMNLQHVAPEDFPSTLINLSDEEFLDMGSQTLLLRDGKNHIRVLFARANLAEFDPARFRRIFGAEYAQKDMEAEDRSWEDWDRVNRIKVPTCTQKWATIRRVLA
jgi:hypothetical protein